SVGPSSWSRYSQRRTRTSSHSIHCTLARRVLRGRFLQNSAPGHRVPERLGQTRWRTDDEAWADGDPSGGGAVWRLPSLVDLGLAACVLHLGRGLLKGPGERNCLGRLPG